MFLIVLSKQLLFIFLLLRLRREDECSARERRLGVYRCCRKWVLTRKQNLRFDIIYCRLSSAWYLRFNESKTTKYQKIETWSENKPFWRGGAGRVVNVSAAPVQTLLVISLPDWTLLIFSDNRGSSWPVNMSVLVYYSSAKKKKKASEWCRGSVWCWGSIHTLIWVQAHTHTHTHSQRGWNDFLKAVNQNKSFPGDVVLLTDDSSRNTPSVMASGNVVTLRRLLHIPPIPARQIWSSSCSAA